MAAAAKPPLIRAARRRAAPLVFGLLALLAGCAPAPAVDGASPQQAGILNSERITRRFGSYGVEVLSQTDRLRVASLYSETHGQRVCRTYAVVQYLEPVDPRLQGPHREIVSGASLGATLVAAGWQVMKSEHMLTTLPLTPRVAELMGRPSAAQLATDIYLLSAVRGGTVIDYAVIAEIHHPDYLRLADLETELHTAAQPWPDDERVLDMLPITRAAMR